LRLIASLARPQAFLHAAEARSLTPGPLADVGLRLEGVELSWDAAAAAAAAAWDAAAAAAWEE